LKIDAASGSVRVVASWRGSVGDTLMLSAGHDRELILLVGRRNRTAGFVLRELGGVVRPVGRFAPHAGRPALEAQATPGGYTVAIDRARSGGIQPELVRASDIRGLGASASLTGECQDIESDDE
jgi:hypothetical protein